MIRLISIAIVLWGIYAIVGTAMYTRELASFHGVNWSLEEHGIALNGMTGFGPRINVKDLETDKTVNLNLTNVENCPGVVSSSGDISMDTIDDLHVCCSLASDSQWFVPAKDVDGFRHYMCNAWPFLEIVKKPLDKTKIVLIPESEVENNAAI